MEKKRFFHTQRCLAYGVTSVGAVIMWQIGIGTGRILNDHGPSMLIAFALNPEFLLRFAAATAAVLAGVAALTDRDGSMLITGFATFLFMLVSLSVFGGQGNVAAWSTQAVYLITMTGLFLAMVATRKVQSLRNGDSEPDAVDAQPGETTQPA